jgi:iron complex transport system substrate-binding protein
MRCLALLLFALLPAYGATAEPLRFIDDAGREVVLDAPARRIVSIAPHVTELLFAAGAGDSLVGVDEFSDFPPAARALPRIGRHASLDLEAIVRLQPDLVVGWASGNRMPQLERLEALGIALYLNEIREIDDIAASVETLGRLAGTQPAAQAAADALRARAEALRTRRDRTPLRVFHQVWERPLMTLNGEHLVSRAIDLCGGENVFADLPTLAPTVSLESVLAADPHVIIVTATADAPAAGLDAWQRWPQLAAVRQGNLLSLPADLLSRAGPRFIDGVEALCDALDAARARIAQPDDASGHERR